jgi:2-dehydropantoate 2-reductase
MRAAILGCGSIGTVLGALIIKNGGKIDLIDVNDEHVDALNKYGAKITGALDFTVNVQAFLPSQLCGFYDVVFLLCKQTTTNEALTAIREHLHENSVVVTLQNGIPEDTVAQIIGSNRTAGGAVLFGATWVAPGVSKCTSYDNFMQEGVLIEIGEINGEITPRIKKICDFLSLAGKCLITTNLVGLRWTKLLINATASGMSAALGCTFGEVLDSEIALKALIRIADETARVAHSYSVQLISVDNVNWNESVIDHSKSNYYETLASKYRLFWSEHRSLKASMLQDLEKGRETEIQFINGLVSLKGNEANIATPFNDMVVSLVSLAQSNRIVIAKDEGLHFFRILLDICQPQNTERKE